MDITIKIKDRKGQLHEVKAPTDMALNLMVMWSKIVGDFSF